ncbi:hypothetical protein PHYSODRAFT_305722 [Phytophthora sojae]|uniref:Chromo domain-containing protein n=1 Tax=Phytophthora sojae (strain P6497) TaxID=1094619 RepID=G5A6A0_PHYSP|nr:hypothetical protein PHYSODRAFT_305722 [Phytophthora sojae]EGZ08855.1 hypothetical protein PHYSODRAFT_305722 [Phytophthora sojae]|eukprot:XP_009535488.1 hypothetical protein PHYSODRAFT_305722 [Phytophthora sojae]
MHGELVFSGQIVLDDHSPVKREGEIMEDYLEVINRWAAHPDEMNYWVPPSSMCEAIDAIAKRRLTSDAEASSTAGSSPVEQFCILQVTSDATVKCDKNILDSATAHV